MPQIMLNGPAERLNDTAVAQPALLIAGLAAFEKLRAENPAAIETFARQTLWTL